MVLVIIKLFKKVSILQIPDEIKVEDLILSKIR